MGIIDPIVNLLFPEPDSEFTKFLVKHPVWRKILLRLFLFGSVAVRLVPTVGAAVLLAVAIYMLAQALREAALEVVLKKRNDAGNPVRMSPTTNTGNVMRLLLNILTIATLANSQLRSS